MSPEMLWQSDRDLIMVHLFQKIFNMLNYNVENDPILTSTFNYM